jgi:methyltransferase
VTLLSDTRFWYTLLVALVACARLCELRYSRRNELRLRAQGAVESGAAHYPALVALHASWLFAAPIEVWALSRPFVPPLAAVMGLLLSVAFSLRYWVITTLGERWTTRVLVLPGKPPITGGPFRFLRHPNYLAVVVEVPALALVHTAWITALAFGVLNVVILAVRIRVEDRAWAALRAKGLARE